MHNSIIQYSMSEPREYWIKNMICNRSLKVIKQKLQELVVTVLSLELGRLLKIKTSELLASALHKDYKTQETRKGISMMQLYK